jgi:hypothetical protein
MDTYICYYGTANITVKANTKEEAIKQAAILLGAGRRYWLVSACRV